MNGFEGYLNILTSIINGITEAAGYTESEKEEFLRDVTEMYLKNYFVRLSSKLSDNQEKEVLSILDSDELSDIKFQKVSKILSNVSEEEECLEIALEELEKIVKEMIHIAGSTLSENSKKSLANYLSAAI